MSQAYISLDLETTGLDADADAIIELAAVRFNGNGVMDTFESLVNPRCPLPYRVERLCGICQTDIDSAPSFDEVAVRLRDFVGDSPIIGHNIQFDLDFLERRHFVLPNRTYDTYELATLLLHQQRDYSLATLTESLDLALPSHRALQDAIAAKDLFLHLLDAARRLPVHTLETVVLLARATGWALEDLFVDALRNSMTTGRAASTSPQSETRREGGSSGRPEAVAIESGDPWSLLEPEGPLASTLPDYEHRPGQVLMAREVDRVLREGGQLAVEAGTGIGKSIAYLLPSIVYSLTNGSPVIISTNTINLQEQLIGKDIPDAKHALSLISERTAERLKVVQLKGRTNYLCMRKYQALRQSDNLSLEEAKLIARVTIWLESTATGDRAELNLTSGESSGWKRICAAYDETIEGKCPHKLNGTCFLQKARRSAADAHLVVVNHALLLSDLAAGTEILPPHDHVIIDEAHRLEDEATNQLGYRVSQRDLIEHLGRFKRQTKSGRGCGILVAVSDLARSTRLPSGGRHRLADLSRLVETSVERANDGANRLFEEVKAFAEARMTDRGDYQRSLRITWEHRRDPGWSRIETTWDELSGLLKEVSAGLDDLYLALQDAEEIDRDQVESLAVETASLVTHTDELRDQLERILGESDPDGICWVTLNVQSSTVALNHAPLEVRRFLDDSLFSARSAVVMTSATMTSEGSFRYMKERLGADGARTLTIDSPFDYQNSTLVYLPNDVPDPGSPQYQPAVNAALVPVCRTAEGRTLVLFTSHAAIRQTQAGIREPLEREGILVLGQGVDGSPKKLIAAFKENPRTVLLGTASFWEGVDIVGDALTVLVIARLPFNVPTEPTFAARSELLDDPFNQYAIPQAIIRFKQGFGRLIRSQRDRGVVIILDRRIQSKRYGAVFLDSIPQCTVLRGPSRDLPGAVESWLHAET